MRSKLGNLLVITNEFPDKNNSYVGGIFVKEQVVALKRYFEKIFVIAPIPKTFGFLIKDHYKPMKNYTIDNVHVFYPKFFHFPVMQVKRYLYNYYHQIITREVLSLLEKEKIDFDLVHAHFTVPSGQVAWDLKRNLGVPYIITVHETPSTGLLPEYKSNSEDVYNTWKNANALIRVDKKYVELLKKFNPNVYSIPNGFDSNRFNILDRWEARTRLGLPQDKKIIFSLGNLIMRKGFQYLIEAMKEIVSIETDILCFIGGRGPLRKKLEWQIGKLGLQDHIKLLGFIPNDEIPLWMNATDIFVLPSLSESFGIVQLEAMACGTPVVATYNGGSEEIITSEDYGLLCPPKDPKCLAEKILIALEKDWDREKIRKYAEQFTWDKVAENIINVYMGVIE